MKGVEAITNAYKQLWTTRENKKPHRYNPDHQREVRVVEGEGRRGRGARDGATGRRGRGRPPLLQAQLPRGRQQTITAYLRK